MPAATRPRRRSRRRARVDERIAIGIAVAAGVAAATSGASPTGLSVVDAILTTLAIFLVTWAAASAPWWTIGVAAGVASALAGSVPLLIVGLLCLVAAAWIGLQRRDLDWARAATAGVAFNVLVRAEADLAHGITVAIGTAAWALVVWYGLRRRRADTRNAVLIAGGAVAGLAVLALVGFAVAAFGAQDGLVDGNRAARAGIEQVNDGNYLEAADRFDEAAAQFADADGSLSAVWTQPARLLPVVAQHRAAGADLAQTAAEASADLAAALRSVNVDDLRILNGRFDLGSLALVEQPFLDVQASFDQLRATIGDVESPWLIEPVQDRLDALAVELDDIEPTLANAVDAVQLAPQLLGADGERTYFLAFTTPAEARGLGGFMGNYAVITADDGALQLVDFGRTGDLNRALDLPGTVSGPDEWLDRYGQYGFTSGPNGGTERFPWSNVTISPDFPSTAEVISELYTQSGGTELDGVFAMDPYVLRELMQLTGPVTVADTGEQLNANNVLDFLLVEQYEIDATDDRVDLLEDVSREVVQRVLRGDLPGPVQVADALSPMAAQGRLVGWSADPDEQDLFERVRLAGGLPDLAGGDGVALVVTNAGANKLDVYLERTLDYAAVVDQRSGQVTGELTVTLHNQAPSDGLPNGVIGNYRGDARGTNRILVSLYTALPLDEVTVGDGEAVNPQLGTEGGWITNSFFVGVPPGGTIDITATVAGVLAIPDGYTLATRPQPLVIPETQRLRVTDLDGKTLIDVDGTAEEPQVYSVGDIDAT